MPLHAADAAVCNLQFCLLTLPAPPQSPLADEWKLEHDATKAAEETAEKERAKAATAAGGGASDAEMADAAAAGAAGSAPAAAEGSSAAAGAAGGKDKDGKEKKKKSPEELSLDILVHFAHTARGFDQVGAVAGRASWAGQGRQLRLH